MGFVFSSFLLLHLFSLVLSEAINNLFVAMEGSNSYRASSSMRRGSPSMWRSNSMEIFSRSSREEDDEEVLKWAAIEKLPTYDRLRKGILTTSHGSIHEISVSNLGIQERKDLLHKLLKVPEEDNESFLLKLKERITRLEIFYLFSFHLPIFSVWFSRKKTKKNRGLKKEGKESCNHIATKGEGKENEDETSLEYNVHMYACVCVYIYSAKISGKGNRGALL